MNDRPLVARAFSWTRKEFAPLLLLGIAAAALLAFVEIVEEVIQGEAHRFDAAILGALRSPGDSTDPIGPWWVETFFRDVTTLGGIPVVTLVTVATLGYLLLVGKRATALLVLVAIAGGAALSVMLKLGFERPRPDLVAHLVDVRTLSFPSGHAMVSTVTYLTIGALMLRVQHTRRLKAYVMTVAIGVTLLVGISRAYLGVHWPTDVLAGWCAGAAWAILCWVVAARLQERGRIEQR
jgi:undecaprenyl-diphosphatase